ncbi:tetratricopeptide repeat protein [Empedobacter falsenii]|uniref:HTH luxR-type domain-containing protein n=1 Tax=Empedobacter falsenii TaxID=343874 RepID=A0AAW7DIS9_9FLAO|nr:hypothetical protein [Empedobacter falsenii]MDM1551568.1 hypothetical protein [Empedobacter falsenii]
MKPRSTILIVFIFVAQSIFANTQNTTDRKIDSLLQRASNYIVVDYEKMLEASEKAVFLTEKTNNIPKKVEAYSLISKALLALNKLDKASYYIDKGLKEDYVKKNDRIYALFLLTQAAYYSRLGIPEYYYKKNKEAFELVKTKNDPESKLIKANLYIKFADYFFEKKKIDSVHFYADKSIEMIESISIKDYNNAKNIFRIKPYIYYYKAWFYIDNNQPEKAKKYIEKSYRLAIEQNYKYIGSFYELYGDYYYQTEDYNKAVYFYSKAIENKKQFNEKYSFIDAKIAKAYHAIGDYNNERIHLINEVNDHRTHIETTKRLLENELFRVEKIDTIQKDNIQKEYIIIIIAIIIIFSIGLIFIYKILKKRKRRIIAEKELQLKEKETKLSENELELSSLHLKVNESFDELIEMAKSNSPHFWSRFQEVYPNFIYKLLEINPNLKNSELTFLAYFYLGFTTKDIAIYTHKALKTIENNRYNIRKRLSLSSDKDLIIWLKTYIDN